MNKLIVFVLNVCFSTFMCMSAEQLEFKPLFEGHNFNFTNCNRTAVPLYVKELTTEPDPIRFDDYLKVSGVILLERDIGLNHNNIEVDISLRIKTKDGYVDLCEIVGEKACHYNDFCSVLDDYMKTRKCPPVVHNNCSCPFLKHVYKYPPLPIRLPKLSFELRGRFEMTISIQEHGKYLGCIEIQFCVRSCHPLGPDWGKSRTHLKIRGSGVN